jgi:hypothetical protein
MSKAAVKVRKSQPMQQTNNAASVTLPAVLTTALPAVVTTVLPNVQLEVKQQEPKQTTQKTARKVTAPVELVNPLMQTKPAEKQVKKPLKKKTLMKKGKKQKTKRVHNTKPTNLNITGIGIGPARVKAVLINTSLNPDEFKARNIIIAAENKPKMPKPVKDKDGNLMPVEMPKQGKQTFINELDDETVKKIKEAEENHELSLRFSYERVVLDKYSKERKEDYMKKRKEYKSTNEKFDVANFNKSFDKNFYKEFAEYKLHHDSYIIGKEFPVVKNSKNGKPREPYNEWTRAAALVNKLSMRLSGNTRNIIACFIDRVVEQLASNALYNCILDKRHILQLRHAIYTTPNYHERVPLSAFIETLHNYKTVLNWLNECRIVREQNKVLKDNEEAQLVEPPYPTVDYLYDFSGYVGEVCRSVRITQSESVSELEKEQYLETSVSYEFKRFCSDLINETILRIGSSLKLAVEREGVKTISDTMVYYIIEQIHAICGLDYKQTHKLMSSHMDTFIAWRAARKLDRVNKKSAKSSDSSDLHENLDQNESDDDTDDEAEVEVEVDDEEE